MSDDKLPRDEEQDALFNVDQKQPLIQKAPFPWFGGKSRVASLVWEYFADINNYVEPFFGSGAVLLGRPGGAAGVETVNDKDGMVANFWRAVQADPDEVARYADWPVNENDLHARHVWLRGTLGTLVPRLEGDPAFYDAHVAGWWVWGMAQWIGGGFCGPSSAGPWDVIDGQLVHLGDAGGGVSRGIVHLGGTGQGVSRKIVHLSGTGRGVSRGRVHLSSVGQGVSRRLVSLFTKRGVNKKLVHLNDGEQGVSPGLLAWFHALQARLRFVRVCCGDWTRVVGPAVTVSHGMTGVFLDPPYSCEANREMNLYAQDDGRVAHDVAAWAVAHGDDPLMRIVLCGYEGEHVMPASWTCIPWKAHGGYANSGSNIGVNAARERLWFSPHCQKPLSLFIGMESVDTILLDEGRRKAECHVPISSTIPAELSALIFIQNLDSQVIPKLEQPAPEVKQPEIRKASEAKEQSFPASTSQLKPALGAVQQESGQLWNQSQPQLNPYDLKHDLEARGHRLLTRDGKFFVSEASKLTEDDRAQIKRNREALIALAEGWSDESETAQPCMDRSEGSVEVMLPFEGLKRVQTIAQFFVEAPLAHNDADFVPDEPPDMTGIDEIVLNFATNGLDWIDGARPVGLTVGTLDGKLCRFLPFAFAGGNLDETVVRRWATEQLRGKKIINSKTKFDVHMAREWGVDLEGQGCTFSDIQHSAALLDDHRKRFALDVLAAKYFPGEHFVPRLDESRHHEHHASEVAGRERVTVQLVGRLYTAMYPELDRQELLDVQKLEDAVIPTVVEMEKNGSPLDLELLERYHAEANRKHGELLWEVANECGFPFDHTAKGWQRLFESLGLPPTKGNAEAIVGSIEHPTVKKAHMAAQYASLDSKTFKAYKENVGSDGILRFEINQLRCDDGGTVSGRFSIGYGQQVPNHDNHSAVFGEELFPRRIFIPKSGEYIDSDAMQIEQRLLVHYAGNKEIIKEYEGDLERLQRNENPVSFHKVTWEMMKRYKPNMLYSHQKSFNFAKQYGAKSIKLAVMMDFITEAEGAEIRGAKRWSDPRLKVIKEIEAAYKRMMPEGDDLLDRAAHLAKPECDDYCKLGDALHRRYPHRGYVKTLLGRRSRFPTNYKTYIGLNRVLQGTGADIMKAKLVELHRERKCTGFVMRLTLHDAVGGDATTPETMGMVSEILNRQSFPLKVPILWECKAGRNWAECV